MTDGSLVYDEFGMYEENAREWDLPLEGPPRVRRVEVQVASGQHVSAVVWGTALPNSATITFDSEPGLRVWTRIRGLE